MNKINIVKACIWIGLRVAETNINVLVSHFADHYCTVWPWRYVTIPGTASLRGKNTFLRSIHIPHGSAQHRHRLISLQTIRCISYEIMRNGRFGAK